MPWCPICHTEAEAGGQCFTPMAALPVHDEPSVVLDVRAVMPGGATVGEALYGLAKAGRVTVTNGRVEVRNG